MLPRSLASALVLAVTATLATPAQAGFFDKLSAGAGSSTVRSKAKVLKNEPGLWRAKRDYEFTYGRRMAPITNVITTAEIERKGTRIPIDFAKPEDVKKLQKGDVVYLGAGLYKSLPANAASGLTFVGQEGKTLLVGTNKRSQYDSFDVYAKDTRFWDMLIQNVGFNIEEGRIYLFNSKVIGDLNPMKSPETLPRYSQVVAVFSKIDVRGRQEESMTHNFRHGGGGEPHRPFTLLLSYGYRNNNDFTYTDIDTSEEFVAARSTLAPLFLSLQERFGASIYDGPAFFTPALAAELQGAYKPMLQAAQDYDAGQRLSGQYTHFHREALDETLRYLAWKTGWTPSTDTAKADTMLAKAAAELEAGNAVLALALVNRTMTSQGATTYAPAVALKQKAEKAVGERYGCAFKGDSAIQNIRAWALQNMPLLVLSTPSPACTITLTRTVPLDPETTESVTASVVETRLQEYDPMAAYKRMMAAAAAKEAEKAYVAGINASTERMADTARKMYDYRVRREGDFLVYGQGDFGGKASAGTLAAQSQAQANAQAYAQAANARGMAVREVQERTDTYFVRVTAYEGVAAAIEKKGEPTRKIAPPKESVTWSHGPCQRKDFRELAARMNQAECISKGALQGPGNSNELWQRYYKTYVYPFLNTFVAESMAPPVFAKIGEAKKSTRPGTQLEAKLLAHFANIMPASDAEITALAEQATGEKISLREFGNELGLN